MTLQEALSSGKRLKRKKWEYYLINTHSNRYSISKEDILANDWEVEKIVRLVQMYGYRDITGRIELTEDKYLITETDDYRTRAPELDMIIEVEE